jgi:hypothetical protein
LLEIALSVDLRYFHYAIIFLFAVFCIFAIIFAIFASSFRFLSATAHAAIFMRRLRRLIYISSKSFR